MFYNGVIMIIKTVNLETVCGITSKLPANTKPEFAFAGKSNVGKSTLINALMNRKAYAIITISTTNSISWTFPDTDMLRPASK